MPLSVAPDSTDDRTPAPFPCTTRSSSLDDERVTMPCVEAFLPEGDHAVPRPAFDAPAAT